MDDKDFRMGVALGAITVLVVLVGFGLLFNSSLSVKIRIGTEKGVKVERSQKTSQK